MKFLNQEEAKRICDKVIAYSKADQCEVGLGGSWPIPMACSATRS